MLSICYSDAFLDLSVNEKNYPNDMAARYTCHQLATDMLQIWYGHAINVIPIIHQLAINMLSENYG